MGKHGQQIALGKPFKTQGPISKKSGFFFRITSFQNQKNEFHA